MGPFSNNPHTSHHQHPDGNKLPVPDVEARPQPVILQAKHSRSPAARRWLTAAIIATGSLTIAGFITFVAYVYISNTPSFMLGSAMQNLLSADEEAGSIHYQTSAGNTSGVLDGDFVGYQDPSGGSNSAFTVSLGQGTGRISMAARLFADTTFFQTAGLSNLGALLGTIRGVASHFSSDDLVRLSSLDGQWFKGQPDATDLQTVAQLYLKHPFLTSAQQFGDEHINGVNSAHLKLGVDDQKLNDFMQAAQNAKLMPALPNDSSRLLGSATLEVWIARSDHTFQQMRLTLPGDNRTDSITVVLRPELAAAQRQPIPRPDGAEDASALFQGINDILQK